MKKINLFDSLVFGIGIVFIVIFLIILIPILIINAPFEWFRSRKFESKLQEFKNIQEGSNYFIYNNRRKSLAFIENEVIVRLPKNVKILYLKDRELKIEDKEEVFLSTLIYSLRNYNKKL